MFKKGILIFIFAIVLTGSVFAENCTCECDCPECPDIPACPECPECPSLTCPNVTPVCNFTCPEVTIPECPECVCEPGLTKEEFLGYLKNGGYICVILILGYIIYKKRESIFEKLNTSNKKTQITSKT